MAFKITEEEIKVAIVRWWRNLHASGISCSEADKVLHWLKVHKDLEYDKPEYNQTS